MAQFKTLLVSALMALPLMAGAQGGGSSAGGSSRYGGFRERAEKREASRWTLQEWLEQRDKNRMMDLWLSMNSPSPFEFMLGGSYLATTTRTAASEDNFYSYAGELAGYAQFVGLGVEHENNVQESYNDLTGMLNLRLLGNSLQNSSLTVSFGQRTRTYGSPGTSVPQRNVFSQASLQLYLARYFGLDGHYRRYEPSTNDVLNSQIGGNQTEAGLFIDFKAVRVFGNWYRDVETRTTGSVETTTERTGVKSGFRIYY